MEQYAVMYDPHAPYKRFSLIKTDEFGRSEELRTFFESIEGAVIEMAIINDTPVMIPLITKP